MITVLLGASSSGKSIIEKTLKEKFGYYGIVSYTTRKKRPGEKTGIDYNFVCEAVFKDMIAADEFVEYEEYTQNRFYGTTKESYRHCPPNTVVVLTPNGYREVEKIIGRENIFLVLVEAPLGTRVKRYIDRCGENNFSFDDMNEINARVNRDYGMFLGLEKEADFIVSNPSGTDITELADKIDKEKYKR